MMTLSQKEIDTILAVPNRKTKTGYRNYCLLLIMSEYAIKPLELLALTVDDVDMQTGNIRIGERTIAIEFDHLMAVREWVAIRPENATNFFSNFKGEPINLRWIQRYVKETAIAAGIEKEVTPMTFYDTCVVRKLYRIEDIRIVAREVGLSSLNHIDKYVNYIAQKDRR